MLQARNLRRLRIVTVLVSFLSPLGLVAAAEMDPGRPSELRCEYLTDPLGIDVLQPRFSWVLQHSRRGESQKAFQILVATSRDLLQQDKGDQWDSGKSISDEQTHVVYQGKPLESRRTYYWKVRYWDKEGNSSPFSQIARFEMGLLSVEEWGGRWIGGGGLLRKEFSVDRGVRRARVYVTALGYYELKINGQRIGTTVLDPAFTTYPKRILYSTYDVTQQVQQGENAIGVMLGGGWATNTSSRIKPYYASPGLLLQMYVELEGGTQLSISSGAEWKVAPGPIVSASVYDGEVYDSRLEEPGWDQPGFDASSWNEAQVIEGSSGIRSAQMMPPIQVTETIVPREISNPRPGVYVFDMGQNFSGWARLRVRGPNGARVSLRFAELLHDDGMINRATNRHAKARDTYILRGEGEEVYEPRFTYHGFRYVEVTGYPGTPNLDSIRGRLVHSAVEATGSFASSEQILNQIHRIVRWSQITNLMSIPTDCPQRNERVGWMDDINVEAEQAFLNYNVAAFFANYLRNIRDEQDPDGTIPDTVPFKPTHGRRPADPNAGAAFPTLLWLMYEQYGDRRILEENYEALKKWVEFLRGKAPDHILRYSTYGDWVSVDWTPEEYVSACYYIYHVDLIGKMAEVLGKTSDVTLFAELEGKIRQAVHNKFFDPATKNYANGSQTANSMALFLELVPEEHVRSVLLRLTDDIVYHHDTHLTTGIQGGTYLLPTLTKLGQSDLAYELATQTTFPSWGYMVARGATTLWELWSYKTGPAMNSHNHPMLGSISAWFYKALGGIDQVPGSAGYRHIRIAPQMVEGLKWASAAIDTVRGPVSVSWNRSLDSIALDVTVPVNSDAEVVIPVTWEMDDVRVREGSQMIWEGGRYVPGCLGILGGEKRVVQTADKRTIGTDSVMETIVFNIGSGRYAFKLTAQ